MRNKVCTTLSLTLGLALFSTLALAQGGSTAKNDKDKNKEHHSRFSKVEFWRRHKDGQQQAKNAGPAPVKSAPAQPKAAQVKPVSSRHVAAKNQGKVLRAGNMSKAHAGKASAHASTKSNTTARKYPTVAHSSKKGHPGAKKTKSPQKAQDRTTA
jgi:hypothetical protein